MRSQKVTRLTSGQLLAPSLFGQPLSSSLVSGYEIHIGETRYIDGARPFAEIHTNASHQKLLDGCITSNGQVFGTYLHGLFDDDSFRHGFLTAARAFYELVPTNQYNNWKENREDSLNRLADAVRSSLDMPQIFSWVGLTYQSGFDRKE
jgi:adenosylcobyric acid synthase